MLRSPRGSPRPERVGAPPASPRYAGLSVFDGTLSKELDALLLHLEGRGMKSVDLFVLKAPDQDLDAVRTQLDRDKVVAKEASVYAVANLLDILVNAAPEPLIPCQMFEMVKLCMVISQEKERIRCLRRLFVCLPPRSKSLLSRLSAFMSNLRSRARNNKVTQERMHAIFAFCVCHAAGEHTFGVTAASLVDQLSKTYKDLFENPSKDIANVEKDDMRNFSKQFLSELRESCNQYSVSLLPVVDQTSKSTRRSSRMSFAWELSKASTPKAPKMLPTLGDESRGRAASLANPVTANARELGKLLYQGKMGAAKKMCELRHKAAEEEKKKAAAAATVAMAVSAQSANGKQLGAYEGATDALQLPNGLGKLVYQNGDVYVGAFVNGEPSGQGELTLVDGSKYSGAFKAGVPHGYGKFVYANGDVYTGEFEDDMFSGKGKYVSAAGTVYEGDFKGGVRHGQGIFQTALGHQYIGQYDDDQMHGIGIYIFKSGEEYRGQFAHSTFHGKGIFKTLDGTLVEGIFNNGVYAGPDPDAATTTTK